MNTRFPGPGINKSECLENCSGYVFSTRPTRDDFPIIKEFLVPTKISEDRFQALPFHTDVWFDFESMDLGLQFYRKNEPCDMLHDPCNERFFNQKNSIIQFL